MKCQKMKEGMYKSGEDTVALGGLERLKKYLEI